MADRPHDDPTQFPPGAARLRGEPARNAAGDVSPVSRPAALQDFPARAMRVVRAAGRMLAMAGLSAAVRFLVWRERAMDADIKATIADARAAQAGLNRWRDTRYRLQDRRARLRYGPPRARQESEQR